MNSKAGTSPWRGPLFIKGRHRARPLHTCLLFAGIVLYSLFSVFCFAQDSDKSAAFEEDYESLSELAERYYVENKYDECIEQLKSLSEQKKSMEPAINYFIALSRYNQLKYWEDTQDWNEYFNNSSGYRGQIEVLLDDAIARTAVNHPVNIHSKLLLWKLYRNQGRASTDELLSEIKHSVLDYSKETKDVILIKEIADSLLSNGEKTSSRDLYKIYVDELVAASSQVKELQPVALSFYKEGNLELSEALYDTYIERSLKAGDEEGLYPVLVNIAGQFSYRSQGARDTAYAEKILSKLEQLAGKDIFTEELLYLRAVNLEKIKDYARAKDIYLDLISRYPQSRYSQEADYKIALIYIYVLADIGSGIGYLEKLSQSTTVSPEMLSSLYQLGLLNQWNNDFTKAKEYYDRLIELAAGGFAEKTAAAKQRLTEITDGAAIEYNLKTFLDVSSGKENRMSNISAADLKVTPYEAKINEQLNVCSNIYSLETGCMQIELNYLWSGDLGDALVKTSNSGFDTKYADNGIKLISLVVVSPSGIVSRGIEFTNVSE